jgi:hypothetical protein
MSTPAQLVMVCNGADFDVSTGECSAPYYSQVPSFVPAISASEGLTISFAIVGTWTIGLVARLLIRAGQQGEKH